MDERSWFAWFPSIGFLFRGWDDLFDNVFLVKPLVNESTFLVCLMLSRYSSICHFFVYNIEEFLDICGWIFPSYRKRWWTLLFLFCKSSWDCATLIYAHQWERGNLFQKLCGREACYWIDSCGTFFAQWITQYIPIMTGVVAPLTTKAYTTRLDDHNLDGQRLVYMICHMG